MTPLCNAVDLAEGEARGFDLEDSGEQDVFLVMKDDRIHAYRNVCPHLHASLNWLPDQFLDQDGEYIICANHGALFRIDDGVCVQGPCAGAALSRVVIVEADGTLYLE